MWRSCAGPAASRTSRCCASRARILTSTATGCTRRANRRCCSTPTTTCSRRAGEELWHSPPFEPTERDGRLYGRGCADDKAGAVTHLGAIAAWLGATGSLPLNVKLIIEGEEEIGSEHLEAFLAAYAAKLMADAIVLTDTANFDAGTPSITVALRGLVAVDVAVRSMDHPLHSGMWGGPIPDPVQALARMIAACTDEAGRMTIPGIYDDVAKPGAAAEASLKVLEYPEALFREHTGLNPESQLLVGAAGRAALELVPALVLRQRHPGLVAQGRGEHHQRQRLGPRRHPHRARHGRPQDAGRL